MKKKTWIILVGGVIILLIALAITVKLLSNNNETGTDGKNETGTGKESGNNNNNTYNCSNKLDENDDYTTYYILRLEAKEGRILKSTPIIKVEFKNEEAYNDFKDDPEYMEDKEYDDTNKTIEFVTGESQDYTVDIEGNELNLSYEEYAESLENVGYTCK